MLRQRRELGVDLFEDDLELVIGETLPAGERREDVTEHLVTALTLARLADHRGVERRS